MKHLTETQKLHIVDLRNRHYTNAVIAGIYQNDVRTVRNIFSKYKKQGNVIRKDGSGRPEKFNVNETIKSLLKDNHGLTIRQIINLIKNQDGIKCSYGSIHERIHKLGYESKNQISKPFLSEKHLDARQLWSIFYKNYDWDSVIWSDETTISMQPNKYSKIWVYKDDPIEVKRTVKYPLKINVWGYILKNNKLGIHIFEKTLTGEKYIEILDLKLLPLLEQHKEIKLVFQQDNAPCHTCKKSSEFFSRNNIETMFWPPNSPDLNPIENIWNLLKREIGKIYIKNKTELISAVNTASNNLKIEIINHLIDSMDNRIEELIDNNFDSINY